MKKIFLIFVLPVICFYSYSEENSKEKKIFELISSNQLHFLKEILKNDKSLINIKNDKSQTPLIYSIILKREEIALYLINKGADYNITDGDGESAIDLAIKNKLYGTIILLLKKGAKTNLDKIKYTPIFIIPYYFSDPFTVNVGKYSKQLLTEDTSEILKLAGEIKKDIENVNLETLYVLSLRLYYLNLKDEAVYWFYTAWVRSLIYKKMVDNSKIHFKTQEVPEVVILKSEDGEEKRFLFYKKTTEPERIQDAVIRFLNDAGFYISCYALGDKNNFKKIIDNVINDNQVPDYFYKQYTDTYFIPDENLKKINDDILSGLWDTIIININKK